MLLGEAETPENTRIYAIGDIHGCLAEATQLFAMIEADMALSPQMRFTIVTVGDYCDRGPDSSGVINFLIEKSRQYPVGSNTSLICLRGNHDQRFLEFMDLPDQTWEGFLTYGGRQTLMSYGIDPDGSVTVAELARAFKQAVPRQQTRFLDNLPLMHVAGGYAFVHAGIRPGIALEQQSADDLLWIRNSFLQFQGAHTHVIVHGHTIDERFDVQANRINVDTGAFESGILSCAVLEGRQMRKMQTPARNWSS